MGNVGVLPGGIQGQIYAPVEGTVQRGAVSDNVGVERGGVVGAERGAVYIPVNINGGLDSCLMIVMCICFSLVMMTVTSNVDLASPYPWLFLCVLVIAGCFIYKTRCDQQAQNGFQNLPETSNPEPIPNHVQAEPTIATQSDFQNDFYASGNLTISELMSNPDTSQTDFQNGFYGSGNQSRVPMYSSRSTRTSPDADFPNRC